MLQEQCCQCSPQTRSHCSSKSRSIILSRHRKATSSYSTDFAHAASLVCLSHSGWRQWLQWTEKVCMRCVQVCMLLWSPAGVLSPPAQAHIREKGSHNHGAEENFLCLVLLSLTSSLHDFKSLKLPVRLSYEQVNEKGAQGMPQHSGLGRGGGRGE